MILRIKVEYSPPYVHTQNDLAKSLIKRIKLITMPLLLNNNLPTTCWGHTVLHATSLLQIRPLYNFCVDKNFANISHLRKFGCAAYIPIPPLQRMSMGPHRKLGTM
jgi:hypothetical protein